MTNAVRIFRVAYLNFLKRTMINDGNDIIENMEATKAMNDIVARLRREAESQRSPMENRGDERIAALTDEAADEIERLREHNAWLLKCSARTPERWARMRCSFYDADGWLP